MGKIIAPSGTECDVADDLAEKLLRRGWTRPRAPRRGATATTEAMDETRQSDTAADEANENANDDSNANDESEDQGATEEDAEADGETADDSDDSDGAQGIDFTAATPKARRK